MYYNPPDMLSVLVESTFLDTNSPNSVHVDYWLVHEDYDAANYFIHDVAVVKLKEPLRMKLFDWKVKLAMKGSYYKTGTPAVLAGKLIHYNFYLKIISILSILQVGVEMQ